MSINSMTVEVKVNVTNMEKFNDLVKEFNKKYQNRAYFF